jgi:ribosomal protein L24
MKIHLCKIMPLDPKTKKPSRVRMVIKGDKKIRVYVKSGEAIDSTTPAATTTKAKVKAKA